MPSSNPPGQFPENELTQMIEEVKRINEQGGARGGGPVNAGPEPTVRSAALGRLIHEVPPLSPEERMDLDMKARELGLMPPVENSEGTAYGTLEEAMAAGAPVGADPAAVAAAAAKHREIQPNFGPTRGQMMEERQTAREFLGPRQMIVEPQVINVTRLPDFSKVQGIDLQRNVAFVDGMEFVLTPEVVADLRTLVLGLAREQVMEQFDRALRATTEGPDGGVLP